jgi:hypothetical protein
MRILCGGLNLGRLRSPTLRVSPPVRPVFWDRDSSLLNSGTIMPDHMGNVEKKMNLFLIFFFYFPLDKVWIFMVK